MVPSTKPKGISPTNSKALRDWAKDGFKSSEMIILRRPSAKTCPNTFVVLWKNPIVPGAKVPIPHICLDIHYAGDKIEAGKPIHALGGFWAKGIEGSLKPQQEVLDTKFKEALLKIAPDVSPDPTGLDNFGEYK